MKKLLLLSLVAFYSCSQDDQLGVFENLNDDDSQRVLSNLCINEKSISEINLLEDTLSVVHIVKDNIVTPSSLKKIPRRAIAQPYDGTAQGTPKKTLNNQKVIISGVTGVAPGVYFADIYTTSGSIELPSGASNVVFDLPEVCGYSDWASREEGVLVTTVQTKKGGVNKKTIKWSFYTMVLNYNAAGMYIGKVLPKDGAKILLPYWFEY